MIHTIHLVFAFSLFFFHTAFLTRAVYLIKTAKGPGTADFIIMNLSQILLPVVLFSGIGNIKEAHFIHILAGLLPVAFMFILGKRSFRRKYPLLLPFINWLLIIIAGLAGHFL